MAQRCRWSTPSPRAPLLPVEPEKVKKVLVVCTGLLGDSVMCTPTFAEIRRLFLQAKVVLLTRPPLKALFAPHKWFDDFIVDEGSPISRRPSRWKAVQKVYQQIRSERFDLSLILLGGDWAPYLCLAKIPLRVDGADNYFARFAHVVYPVNAQHLTLGGFLEALRAATPACAGGSALPSSF